MTNERFTELLNGPLAHPLYPMRINRLALALVAVLRATGEKGAEALEAYCKEREERDEANATDYDPEDAPDDGADEDAEAQEPDGDRPGKA